MRTGITGIRRGGAFVGVLPGKGNERYLAGIGAPFQAGPSTAGVFVNLRPVASPGVDFEGGADVILFDDLARLDQAPIIPVTRNEEIIHPRTGKPYILVKFPVQGGLVPLGARRADGSPHPRGGTGFGLAQCSSFPALGAHSPNSLYEDPDRFSVFEVLQFSYDGSAFRVAASARLAERELLPGFTLLGPGLSNAVPDGEDLLLPVTGRRDGERASCGVLRWQRSGDAWRPVDYRPALVDAPEDEGRPIAYSEPSCLRDRDGSLLLTARRFGWADETRPECHDVPVWRSRDEGTAWVKLSETRGIRAEAPMSIGQAADGAPYVSGCLKTGRLVMDPGGYAGAYEGTSREILCLWPLSEDRRGLEPMLVVRDGRADFGVPPTRLSWRVDHPIGCPVRLRDNAWRGILGYRVMDEGEYGTGAGPSPWTGMYLDEVVSCGQAQAIWRF